MTPFKPSHKVGPDSLVALLPVTWAPDDWTILTEVHPQNWAELLRAETSAPSGDPLTLRIGDGELSELPSLSLIAEERLPQLNELIDLAKHPFDATERLLLENHTGIWRITMENLSTNPIEKARAFLRVIATATEAGAPAAFFPFSFQLHSSQLIRHLSVEMQAAQTLVNLLIGAFNDDEWMVTRGMTALGFPELETSLQGGMNGAYFRLLDVATQIFLMESPFRVGSNLQLGAHLFEIQAGPRGPEDKGLPICGAFGRLAILPV